MPHETQVPVNDAHHLAYGTFKILAQEHLIKGLFTDMWSKLRKLIR